MRGRVREMRTRAGKRMYKEVWNQIRTGWCLGGQDFQEKILERVRVRMEGKQRESYSGEERRRHDEREAERRVKQAMKALGVTEEELTGTNKGALNKSALAWYVHRRVMASHKWISARLNMGCPSNLTLYINRIETAAEGEALRLRRKLEET